MSSAGQSGVTEMLVAGVAMPASLHVANLTATPAAALPPPVPSPKIPGTPTGSAVFAPPPPSPALPAGLEPAAFPPPALAPALKPSFAGPASLFDAVTNRLNPVVTTVEVNALADSNETEPAQPLRAGGQDVLTTAGTFGDVSRYLQLFPGVVASSDVSNQVLVRGGHPMENLFLVDGIEVPNINHLANANTTGGFGPMIDAAAIQGLEFYSGAFEAKYPERLSSVTEFHTLDNPRGRRHAELDFGVQGIGGLAEQRVRSGDLLVSAHHGLVNLVSQDVGINGVPSYTNELTRYRRRTSSGDSLTLLNVAGLDTISITPCATDPEETSTIDSTYDGWRETTGVEWQHVHSIHAFSAFNLSDSEQLEHIHQEDQLINPLMTVAAHNRCPLPHDFVHTTPVYTEDSNNAFSTAKYDFQFGRAGLSFSAGSAAWLQRPQFAVDQPNGAFSPYDPTMTRQDSTSFNSNFAVGESGTYAQTLFHPFKALSLSAGGRMQSFAFGNHLTFTPRLNAAYQLGERTALHAGYASYTQMPPYAYMLAYPVNRTLAPMRATHEVVGLDLGIIPHSQLRAEAYFKAYSAIPASTEYPGVTMHTMIDMLGEQTVWLPLTSGGRGEASGLELFDRTRIGARFQALGSIAYARARFSGLDGVLHPSNFDLPWVINAAGVEALGRGVVASARYGFASGRPYTPFDMTASLTQNRPIYDLSQINVPRAPSYSRLDAQVNKEMAVRSLFLEIYMGVDNVLNHENYLSYAWMPRYKPAEKDRNPVGTLWQTPIFPNFGVRLIVR
jgi:hypothetical protein